MREVHADVILRRGPVEPALPRPEVVLPDRRNVRRADREFERREHQLRQLRGPGRDRV